MKKGKAIGCLFAFTALVASGISFSGVKKVTADDIPREQHYVVPAGTVTNPFSYSDNYANEPNYKNTVQYRSTATGSDGVYYEFNQNSTVYSRMNVGSTWNSYRGEGVKVAVIDTGCYTSHEDFSGTNFSSLSKNIYNGGTSASSYTDTNGHGTSSVSTIAAAINSKGGLGIASNVELVVLKIDHPTYGMQLSYLESALQWCINNDVDVINMSLQGYESTVHYSYTEDFGNTSASGDSQGTMNEDDLSEKLTACYNAGITVVASAGNYNTSQKSYPAANDHVIAVASTGLTEANKYKKAGYSNYGDWVDICAPGYISTPTTSSTSSYSITYGTSFSSPLVAGAIALYKCKYPNATPDQIEAALKYTARSLTWSGSGAGLIDVEEFLAHAPVESVTVNETEIELNTTETYNISATVLPSYAEQGLRYESLDSSVCTVDSNGKITAKGVGNTLVGVYSIQDDKVYEIIDVTVTKASGTPQTSSVTLSNGVASGNPLSKITWTIDNVLKIEQEKGTGTSFAEYIDSPRWYKNNLVTFTPLNKTITNIEFSTNSTSYANVFTTSTWSTGSASVASGSYKANWSGSTSEPFTLTLSDQTRPTGIKVTYVSGSGGGSQTTNYTVTFDPNGGTGNMSNQQTTGSSYTVPSCLFTKTNYTFSKWALNSTSGTQYAVGATINDISSNITLYAIWTENSSTTINDNYGNYYESISSDYSGNALVTALHNLNQEKKSTSFNYTYNNLRGKFQKVDYDWTGQAHASGKIVGFYDNKILNGAWDSGQTWNREHVWPDSLGGDNVEGDLHMVRPTNVSINSARGNKYYGTGSSNYDPGSEGDANYRGIAARIIFYCAIAYTDFQIVDSDSSTTVNKMGKLSDLLQWNLQYLPNTSSNAPLSLRVEQNRNKQIYSDSTLQGNRNPFIDHPEYACKIWGNTNSATRSICGLSGDTLSLSSQSATLETGKSLTITATPSGTGTVNWSVDNPNIITLSATTGNEVTITAGQQVGTAKITVTYGTATAYCNVTVTFSGGTTPVSDSETITFSELGYSDQTAVTSVNGTNFNVSFDKGTNSNAPKYYTSGSAVRVYGSNTFTVSSTTKNIVKIELTFGSGDGSNAITTDKATYSNGIWTGSASSVTFTVGGTSGNRRIAAIKVTYESSGGTPDPVVNSISIVEALNLDVYNNKTYTFEPVIDAEEGADTTISWESSDTTVATITDDGTITALKQGSTTITATCGGKSDTCQVTVTDSTPVAVTSVSLDKTTASTTVGSSVTLTATVYPTNASNKNVTWSTSNSGVATVNNGVVQGVSVGTATITVTTVDGNKTATCTVTVNAAPVITYGLEADVNEVPFMSGTNHVASVGVKVYQYSNGSNKTCVDTGSVNVDTSSLGYKTVSYVYNSVTYTTTVKVTNNETTYSESSQTQHSLYSGSSSSYQELNSQGGTKTYNCEVNNATKVDFSFTIQHTGNSNTKFTHVVTMYTKSGSNTTSETCVINISSKPATRTYTGSVTFTSAIDITSFVLEFTTKQSGSNLRIQNVSATITAGGSNDFTLLEQAKAWGEYFIDQTRTQEVCLADTDAAKLSGLQSKWADLAYEYNHMVSGAKDVFFTSDDSKIVEARSHYLFILSKFGASSLGDDGAFVKDSSDHVLQAKANNVFNMLKDDSSTEMIIIISVVSVLSVGVCLLIKKKKRTIKSN